jgi:hypothetical protein
MKDTLEQVRVPDADAARERANAVVRAAFAEREPLPARSGHRRAIGAAIALASTAIVLAVVSPPGRAVIDRVREAVGIERATPALFTLPGGGRLLVSASDGVWVVEATGKKRLLAGYREASWSPFGRYLIATRDNELAALEPDGDVRWTLARPRVSSAQWTGTEIDTRIAYHDRSGIRVVAGDGTGDRLLAPSAQGPLAWRPGPQHALAYIAADELRIQDVDNGRLLLRVNRGANQPATRLAWSSDGRRLLVLTRNSLQIFDAQRELIDRAQPADGGANVDAAFQPGTHRAFVVRVAGNESSVVDVASGRTRFSGSGVFDQLSLSPDGRWLLVSWPTADQWVFIRTDQPRTLRAISGISTQFRGTPTISNWCCDR